MAKAVLTSPTENDRVGEEQARIHVMQQICSSEAAATISYKQLQSLLNTALSKRSRASARAAALPCSS
jgi:hypothetical protein